MNRACLIGRLTDKPVLRQTTSGLATTNFSIAVNRNYTNADGKREVDFIPVRVWRKQAENICKYLDKGSPICVEGRIQTGSYTDQKGNKRYFTEVVSDNVTFLNSKKKGDTQEPQSDTEQVDIYSEFGEEIEDNYLD